MYIFENIVTFLIALLQGKTIGEFSKDKFPGEFMDGWRNALKDCGLAKVSI